MKMTNNITVDLEKKTVYYFNNRGINNDYMKLLIINGFLFGKLHDLSTNNIKILIMNIKKKYYNELF